MNIEQYLLLAAQIELAVAFILLMEKLLTPR
jgi:hypothetical protein